MFAGFIIFITAIGAGMIQSITGFGSAIVMMLVLPHFMDMVRAPALSNSIVLGLTMALAWKMRKHVDYRQSLPMAAIYITVSVTIIRVVQNINLDILNIAFALFLIGMSLYFLLSERMGNISIKATPLNGIICSAIGGAFGGMFGAGGPTVAMYFLAACKTKESYIGTFQMMFTISNIVNLYTRIRLGIYTWDLLPLTIVGFVGVTLGKSAGLRVLNRLDISLMKKIVYIFIGVSGILTLVSKIAAVIGA